VAVETVTGVLAVRPALSPAFKPARTSSAATVAAARNAAGAP
jgi:hypothetical protein